MKFEVAEGTQEVGYQSGFIQKNRIRNGRILISGELNWDIYPAWHLVSIRLSVVVVEDHDGGDHAAGHHEHDAVKIGSWQVEEC